ncbi:hypothetical protein LEP1GSC076_0804 [Leptospira sp. Fiocruz LV4135]|nr:hypothetical protein LEP1GSC076_0804 [Leptospira sp. Fiocruz LV4135]
MTFLSFNLLTGAESPVSEKKEYSVDIKKKFGSKRFSGIGKNEPG